MGAMASLITSLMSVYSIVHSATDQRKHQSSASLAFVRGIDRWIPFHKWPVTPKMFPFDDVIMHSCMDTLSSDWGIIGIGIDHTYFTKLLNCLLAN